jgi:hypothetical protein
MCDGDGNCVECNVDGQCGAGEVCTDNACVPGGVDLPLQTKAIELACNNSAQPQMSSIPTDLTVDPGPTLGGSSFTADLTGNLSFPESFLDVATGVLPPGTTFAQITLLEATVEVRSGATGPNVALGVDPTIAEFCAVSFGSCDSSTNVCVVPAAPSMPGGPTATACTQTSDCPSPQFCGNAACGNSALDTCGPLVFLPLANTQTECATLSPGRTCSDSNSTNAGASCTVDGDCPGSTAGVPAGCIGAACTTAGYSFQACENVTKLLQLQNFFGCVTGDLLLPLDSAVGSYTAGASGGDLLFGWIDDVGTGGAQLKTCPDGANVECYTTTANCTLGEPATPVCAYDGNYADGTSSYWSIQQPQFNNPIGALGLKINAGLLVGIECVMGKDISRPECEGLCENGTNNGTACPNGDPDCTGGGTCGLADPSCGCFNNECGTILGQTVDADLIGYTIP